jgi:integrase
MKGGDMARRPQVRYFASRGGYYCQIHGKQHPLAKGEKDEPNGPVYKAAVKAYANLVCNANVAQAGDDNTVRAICNAYLSRCEGKVSADTLKGKRHSLAALVEEYGELRYQELKPWHLDQVIAKKRKPRQDRNRVVSWNNAMVRVFVKHVQAAFRWAAKTDLVSKNRVQAAEKPAEHTNAREDIVSPAEHAAVLAGLWTRRSRCLKRLVIALENTGARPGELRKATVRDFKPELGAIVYYADDKRRQDETSHKNAKKGKDRTIYLTGDALNMVKELVAGKKPAELIFPSNTGKPYADDTLCRCFKGLSERLAIPHLVPNAYRHTFATRWLMAGRPIEQLAELLGNTPAVILKHYSHLCKQHDALRAALEDFKRTSP